jgi:hypothetical protein
LFLFLCVCDDFRSAQQVQAGALPVVVTALNNHIASSHVQAMGCRALATLASYQEFHHAIGTAQGIPALLTALHTHMQVASVPTEGIVALRNLASAHSTYRDMIAQNGGTAIAKSALKLHPREPVVVRFSQELLGLLS